MNRFRPALDVELQPSLLQLLLHRSNEPCYIEVTRLTRRAQLLFDHVIHLRLQILQRQILQFPLNQVQAQLMRQWGIQVRSLRCHTPALLIRASILNLSHQVHAVSDNDENHPHILRKRQQQITEILCLNGRILRIQFIHPQQSVNDVRHILAKRPLHILHLNHTHRHTIMQQDADDRRTVLSNLLSRNHRSLQVKQNRVQPKLVTMQLLCLDSPKQNLLHLMKILRIQHLHHQSLQALHRLHQQHLLILPQSRHFFHTHPL